jgi:predicted thioredoxin/glutaredoxin
MNITLFVTKRCDSCDRVRAILEKVITKGNGLKLCIEDIKTAGSKGIVIVPALFIEDELYAYGDIDEEKLLERLQIHSSSH